MKNEKCRADFSFSLSFCIFRFTLCILLIDLLRKDSSTAMSKFRLRLCKNYSTYIPYMPHNFCFASPEIWTFRYENLYAVGLLKQTLEESAGAGDQAE